MKRAVNSPSIRRNVTAGVLGRHPLTKRQILDFQNANLVILAVFPRQPPYLFCRCPLLCPKQLIASKLDLALFDSSSHCADVTAYYVNHVHAFDWNQILHNYIVFAAVLLALASQRIESIMFIGGSDNTRNGTRSRENRGSEPTSIEWMIMVYVLGTSASSFTSSVRQHHGLRTRYVTIMVYVLGTSASWFTSSVRQFNGLRPRYVSIMVYVLGTSSSWFTFSVRQHHASSVYQHQAAVSK